MTEATRICVFGAGGVGGYLAATLARAGRRVAIVARGEHLRAIQRDGLRVSSGGHDFQVRLEATDEFASLDPQDVVIVSTKSNALAGVARSLGPHLKADTRVLFAVNGVFWFYADCFAPAGQTMNLARLDPDSALHRQIGVNRSYGMVVRSPNDVVAPGHILNDGGGRYCIGSASGDASSLNELQALLDVPGARVEVTNNIRLEMWRKAIRNVAVALVCVPVQSSPGAAFGDPAVRKLALSVMREASDVARAHGFTDILDLEQDANVVARMKAMKPSIVQDLERGRPMEIDAQVLAIQDLARQAGLRTPTIDLLTPLVVLRARLAGCFS